MSRGGERKKKKKTFAHLLTSALPRGRTFMHTPTQSWFFFSAGQTVQSAAAAFLSPFMSLEVIRCASALCLDLSSSSSGSSIAAAVLLLCIFFTFWFTGFHKLMHFDGAQERLEWNDVDCPGKIFGKRVHLHSWMCPRLKTFDMNVFFFCLNTSGSRRFAFFR